MALQSLELIISRLYTGGSNGYIGKQQIQYSHFQTFRKYQILCFDSWTYRRQSQFKYMKNMSKDFFFVSPYIEA